MKTLHLICNAHIDPVWLWDWEEGAAAAVSTFRSAADLAEEFDFIFCHNEALLYQWIEEYDPSLFERIRDLCRRGKWKVMGGWYLQPDCCMPTGESLVRQMMEGRAYFAEKLGQSPTTAVNVDPFGHSIGLPQILRGCGFDSYLICRPIAEQSDIPDDFLWEGMDGSTVRVCRASDHYNSAMGEAAQRIRNVLQRDEAKDVGLLLWGVGNHGGGPSRKDLADIQALMAQTKTRLLHSTPEQYMAQPKDLPTLRRSLRCMPGCYTSMVPIKQRHRLLESRFFQVEKMCTAAAIQAQLPYPHKELEEAQRALMFAQFHDILPGSSVPSGAETGLRVMDYGLEIVSRLRTRAMFALTAGERRAAEGEYPVLVYNPHPYPVQTHLDFSFILQNQNWDNTFTNVRLYSGDSPLPSQVVKEYPNMQLDWAKRVVFSCTLAPMSVNRFDARTELLPQKPVLPTVDGDILFENSRMRACIGAKTGLLEFYEVDGLTLLDGPTAPVLYRDNADPWAMSNRQFQHLATPEEPFRLMTPEEAAQYAGSEAPIAPLRIVEDGPVLTEIESLLCCRSSAARINWRLYQDSGDIDVAIHLLFLEKDALVKWHLPLAFTGTMRGQTAYGQEKLIQDGRELVAQDWIASCDGERMLSVLRQGSYGLDCSERELRLSLVRSPAHAAHPIPGRPLLQTDRYIPRIDQGEHTFRFRLTGGSNKDADRALERNAQVFAEEPFCLQCFPTGSGDAPLGSLLQLEGDQVVMTALKASKNGGYILRLFNNTPRTAICQCKAAFLPQPEKLVFRPYEVRTLRITEDGLSPCSQMEI